MPRDEVPPGYFRASGAREEPGRLGEVEAMPVVALVGAGSTVFTRKLVNDLCSFDDLRDEVEFRLHDIDSARLATSDLVSRRIIEGHGAAANVTSTTELPRALDGADHVVTMFQIGGFEPATLVDFDIPESFGLQQTIADTLGLGGIMRGLRTVPALLEVAAEMRRSCPDAILLNYANPMAINMWGLAELANVTAYGLCHSIPATAADLARDLGIPYDDLDYVAAGINHMAFYLRLEHEGRDLYPELKTLHRHPADAPLRRPWDLSDAVRYEMLRRLGYFVAESSEHFAEYTPYFIKRDRPDLIERYRIPIREYVRRCQVQIADWDSIRSRLEAPDQTVAVSRSLEFAPQIIHSIEADRRRTVYVNVPNHGLIDNLPRGCTVEVPATVDANGVMPAAVGPLPAHLAALIRTNVGVQELTVEALKTGRRAHVYHAAMLDPHTAAELDLDQIWHVVDALLDAHGDYIPEPLRSNEGD